jgi:hypothetical protein
MVEKGGPTKGLFLLSNNAFVAAPLLAFLFVLNKKCLLSSLTSGHTSSSISLSSSSSEELERRMSSQTNNSMDFKASDDLDVSNDYVPMGNCLSSVVDATPATPTLRDSNEADNSQDFGVNEFVKSMQSLYWTNIGNWDLHVEPYISQWLTWECIDVRWSLTCTLSMSTNSKGLFRGQH